MKHGDWQQPSLIIILYIVIQDLFALLTHQYYWKMFVRICFARKHVGFQGLEHCKCHFWEWALWITIFTPTQITPQLLGNCTVFKTSVCDWRQRCLSSQWSEKWYLCYTFRPTGRPKVKLLFRQSATPAVRKHQPRSRCCICRTQVKNPLSWQYHSILRQLNWLQGVLMHWILNFIFGPGLAVIGSWNLLVCK